MSEQDYNGLATGKRETIWPDETKVVLDEIAAPGGDYDGGLDFDPIIETGHSRVMDVRAHPADGSGLIVQYDYANQTLHVYDPSDGSEVTELNSNIRVRVVGMG